MERSDFAQECVVGHDSEVTIDLNEGEHLIDQLLRFEELLHQRVRDSSAEGEMDHAILIVFDFVFVFEVIHDALD